MEKLLIWLTSKKAVFLIIILGLVVYSNSLFNGFVWDDEEQIVNNQVIQSLANLPQIFSGATFSTGGGGLSGWFFRPLLTFSYMLNYAIWGQNAFGFHLFQLIFHLANSVLLFKILQILLKDFKNKFTLLTSLFISLIFVVHPAITEAVSYVAALSEVMYTFLNLSAFYLLLKSDPLKPKFRNLLLVSLLLFLGLLFKESAIIIFPIIIIYLFLYKRSDLKYWLTAGGVTLAFYFFMRLVLVQTPIRHPQFAPISETPLLFRLMTIPQELFSYLRIVFFPDRLAISQHFVVVNPTLFEFFFPLALSLLFLGLIFFLAWKLKSKLMLLGLSWFILGFLLISNIFPLDMTIAERWLYFPILGLMLVFAAVLFWFLTTKPRFLIPLSVVLILAILGLGTRTMVRNNNWRDGLTLYRHDIKISKNSFDLENNLGVELFRNGQYAESKKHFEKSIELQPKWHFAYNNLGAVYEQEKDYQKAKEFYQKTLEISDYYLAYENLAKLVLFQGGAKEAKEFTEDALKKLPYNSNLWLTLALAEDKLGNRKEAERAFYIYSRLKQGLPLEFK